MKLIYLSAARLPDEWAHGLQIMKMCEAFALAGHEVELVAPRRARTPDADPFSYYDVKKNFRLVKLPCLDLWPGAQSGTLFFMRSFSFLFFAKLYLFFKRYDALYTRETLFLPFFPRAKTVLELHSVPGSARVLRRIARLNKAVVITRGIKEDLEKKHAAPPSILVAPDAVDPAQFANPESKEAARARLGLPQDRKIALYIGRLDSWKGVEVLFEAAARVKGALVAVIGGEKDEVEAYGTQYPRVHFCGFRPFTELADNQAAADVLVLPNTARNTLSERYTSPMKLFTYMASGRPIVASSLPSIREVLDEETAVLVEPDNPQALADGINKVLDDAALAARLAQAARQKVEQYTWQKRAESIIKFISS